jgi:carnitine O-acetyltransferase
MHRLARPRFHPRTQQTGSLRFMSTDLSKVCNASRPPAWKTLAPAIPNISARDLGLPRLPVPSLEGTVSRLKSSLQSMAHTMDEYEMATRKIDAFLSTKGLATTLQERLEARAKEDGREHWLEEWWDDGGYLGYRDSVSLSRIRFPTVLSIILNEPGSCKRVVLLCAYSINVHRSLHTYALP